MNRAEPIVGVGVIVVRDRKVLLGHRTGSHGAGTWALPGGHLEFGETVDACARRETLEETGLELQRIVAGPYTSDVFAEPRRHYVTLFVIAESTGGDPQVLEPTKCAEWRWVDWAAMPAPLFQPLQTLFDTGFLPFSVG